MTPVEDFEITTYSALGVELDTALAETAEDATCAARTLLEDAQEAGHELRDLTVIFKCGGQEIALGRDATLGCERLLEAA